jgi:hypothetical protein
MVGSTSTHGAVRYQLLYCLLIEELCSWVIDYDYNDNSNVGESAARWWGGGN